MAEAYCELPNSYPRPGRVEQDPEDVVRTVVETVGEVLDKIGGANEVAAVGLDNQGRPPSRGMPKPGVPSARRSCGPTAAGSSSRLA